MKSKLRVIPCLILLLPLDLIVAIGILLAQLPSLFGRGRRALGAPGEGPRSNQILRPSPFPEASPYRARASRPLPEGEGNLLATKLRWQAPAGGMSAGCHRSCKIRWRKARSPCRRQRQRRRQCPVCPGQLPRGRHSRPGPELWFTGGNNHAANRIDTDIIVFLNNDMVVDRGFLQPLLNPFSDPSVFAVTSQIFFSDQTRRREETGKTRARFGRGFFYFWHDAIGPEDENLETLPVLWAGGGSCAIDRRKFLAIGGFDPLYHPFYFEDTDVSYQAWKRGWKCLLAPASRVIHKHRATTKAKFSNRFVELMVRKNQYLFTWKNVTDSAMIFQHLRNLPRIHARGMVQYGPLFEAHAFVRAVQQLPQALAKRLSNLSCYAIPDREVLARSQKS
ncbi:MAG: hypothetical protein DMG19_03620 [Acidobacteria bacterium]|nr:MAG: hypothetical protein DMG19_03620 [Acidobacteriota bacterium]